MVTTVDAPRVDPPGRRRTRAWFRSVLVVLIVAIAVMTALLVRSVWAGEPEVDPATLKADLQSRITMYLEAATPEEHAEHGHDLADVPSTTRFFCAVDIIGTEPAAPRRASEVTKVYANHLCSLSDNGRPWDYAVKTSGPVVAAWGDPLTLQVIGPERYQEKIAELIPEPLRARATGTFADDKALADMRARFDADVQKFWADRKAREGTG